MNCIISWKRQQIELSKNIVTSNENKIVEAAHESEKQITNLFIAQNDKPADLDGIDLTRLTPFQRALLVTDGTVTRFLEAYTLSAVKIVLIGQETQTLPAYVRCCFKLTSVRANPLPSILMRPRSLY